MVCVNIIVASLVLSPPSPQGKPASSASAPAVEEQPAAGGELLTGPAITEEKPRLTIVHQTFDGALEEIESEPDVAAITLLPLSDEQRMKFEAIISDRLSAFDDCVRRNYGLVLELATLQGQSDAAKAMEVLQRVRAAFATFTSRGSCLDEMKAHLSPEQIEQVGRMLDEYRAAKMAEWRRILGEDAPLRQIASRARLEAFGRMLRQSIERHVGLARELFEQIADELSLTDEQRRKAEAIFQPLAVKQFQRTDTPAERADAFRQFRQILDSRQRLKLLSIIVKQWRPENEAEAHAAADDDAMKASESEKRPLSPGSPAPD